LKYVIYISEWLPNPNGPDAKGEFVEIYNSGDAPVGLNGWVLKTENGKKISLAGRSIPAGGYLAIKRSQIKFTLRNNDGGLALYGSGGALVERASFIGAAPEGKSFSRVDYGIAPVGHFAFMDPTPGAPNKTINNTISANEYPFSVPLNAPFSSIQFLAIMVGVAMLLVGLIMYGTLSNEDLSKLFFKGNNEVRRETG